MIMHYACRLFKDKTKFRCKIGVILLAKNNINLSLDRVLKTPIFDGGGGLNRPIYPTPPLPFLFVKTIEKVIRLCTVLIFFCLLSGSFEDMGIFHEFQLSFVGVGGGFYISIADR